MPHPFFSWFVFLFSYIVSFFYLFLSHFIFFPSLLVFYLVTFLPYICSRFCLIFCLFPFSLFLSSLLSLFILLPPPPPRSPPQIVSNVPSLFEAVDYLCDDLGLHEFSEFTAEDVGTVDSGLNSMVLANNNEYVLLPINEPTFGTRRKSQIQNFLEHNNGAGVQVR